MKALFSVFITMLILASSFPANNNAWAASRLRPRWVETKPSHTEIQSWQSSEWIELKFVEGSRFRLRDGQITSQGGDNLTGVAGAFARHPVEAIERLFSQPEEEISAEKAALQAESGEQLPDLNLWFRLKTAPGTDAASLIDALNALPEVEIAYPASLPSPLPATPNFMPQQGYLNPSTGGVDAKYAWTIPGGTGRNVSIVDIEYSFNKNHEDLPPVAVVGGMLWNGFGNDHGTAVIGELAGKRNGYGVTGIASGAAIKFSSPCFDANCSIFNVANAINNARLNTKFGDVILLEQQTPVCNLPDYGPVEWEQAAFDAIKIATSSGRNVVEAAGNGNVNLDQTGCNNKFNRTVRDSGAIVVGAGAPPNFSQKDRSRLYFSTYGSRVDVQGWGEGVATTGYGTLYTGSGPNQWYTSSFNGTSSASPIVTGVVAVLSSIAQEQGTPKSPAWIRSILTQTGAPQLDAPSFPVSQHIGPRPNLKKAIAKLNPPFNTSFNGVAPGWAIVRGAWNYANGAYFRTAGIADQWSSIVYEKFYTSFDYQARVRRVSCAACANALQVRGVIGHTAAGSIWYQGYSFQYNNNQRFSVWKITPEGSVALKGWTAFPGIVANGWNTLRAVGNGAKMSFYINGALAWTGTDTTLTFGNVGIATYNQGQTSDSFMVDWATLSTSVANTADELAPFLEETDPLE